MQSVGFEQMAMLEASLKIEVIDAAVLSPLASVRWRLVVADVCLSSRARDAFSSSTFCLFWVVNVLSSCDSSALEYYHLRTR